jgi:hypothetical protein
VTIQSMQPQIVPVLVVVLPWVVVGILTLTMVQRRYMDVGIGKRFATLQLGGLVAILWAATLVFDHFSARDVLLLPVCALLMLIAVVRRKSIFPYRLRCASCGMPLPLKRILFHDEPRCAGCERRLGPQEGEG